MIDIALFDGKFLYDTPGIVNHHQMAHYVNEHDLKVITPKNEVKPKNFQLNDGQTLFLGGLARFDFTQGERTSFTCYISNDLHIHRTKTEGANAFYKKHIGVLLTPPSPKSITHFPNLEKYTFQIRDKKMDIVYSGLGWITIHGTNIQV